MTLPISNSAGATYCKRELHRRVPPSCHRWPAPSRRYSMRAFAYQRAATPAAAAEAFVRTPGARFIAGGTICST